MHNPLQQNQLSALEDVLSKIDGNRFPYIISNWDYCLHFFDKKVRMSPEILLDLWSYHKLHPNTLLMAAEKYIPLLRENEEMDFHFRLSGFAPPETGESLLLHEVTFCTTGKLRQLGQCYLEGPSSLLEEDCWDVLIPK